MTTYSIFAGVNGVGKTSIGVLKWKRDNIPKCIKDILK